MTTRSNDIRITPLVAGTVVLAAALTAALVAGREVLFTARPPYTWSMVLAVTLGLFEVGSLLWVRSGLRQSNASYTVRIYMALKVVKLMLFLGLVVGYWADVETGTKEFVSTAAGIYLIYLMWDVLPRHVGEKEQTTKSQERVAPYPLPAPRFPLSKKTI